MSLLVMRSSLGYNMLLHSRQKRKVICSWAFVGWASAERLEGAGDAMVLSLLVVLRRCEIVIRFRVLMMQIEMGC